MFVDEAEQLALQLVELPDEPLPLLHVLAARHVFYVGLAERCYGYSLVRGLYPSIFVIVVFGYLKNILFAYLRIFGHALDFRGALTLRTSRTGHQLNYVGLGHSELDARELIRQFSAFEMLRTSASLNFNYYDVDRHLFLIHAGLLSCFFVNFFLFGLGGFR